MSVNGTDDNRWFAFDTNSARAEGYFSIVPLVSAPEPPAIALMGLGLLGIALTRRKAKV